MALLVKVASLTLLNSKDHGQRSMGSQTLVVQQLRFAPLSTPASIFADRVASTCSWARANADTLPSTSQTRANQTRNKGRRNGAAEEIQGFGLGSGLYGGVRISNKWKSQPRNVKHRRNVGIARAYMKLDPGGGGPDKENGIGRVVVNLAIAGGLTYLTITGKLGWLFDAFVSLWVSSHCAICASSALGLEILEEWRIEFEVHRCYYTFITRVCLLMHSHGVVEMACEILEIPRSVYVLVRVFIDVDTVGAHPGCLWCSFSSCWYQLWAL